MANAGVIRANAMIQCVEDETTHPLGDFLQTDQTDSVRRVEVKNVNMSFDDTVKTAGKWLGAVVLIGAFFLMLYMLGSALSDR